MELWFKGIGKSAGGTKKRCKLSILREGLFKNELVEPFKLKEYLLWVRGLSSRTLSFSTRI